MPYILGRLWSSSSVVTTSAPHAAALPAAVDEGRERFDAAFWVYTAVARHSTRTASSLSIRECSSWAGIASTKHLLPTIGVVDPPVAAVVVVVEVVVVVVVVVVVELVVVASVLRVLQYNLVNCEHSHPTFTMVMLPTSSVSPMRTMSP